jgi:hypothetical protein
MDGFQHYLLLCSGIYGYTLSFAGEHICFFIPAPIAAFIVNYLLWHWTFKTKADYKLGM